MASSGSAEEAPPPPSEGPAVVEGPIEAERPGAPPAPTLPLAAGLALLALAVAVAQKGAYYAPTRGIVVVLAVATLAVALLGRHRPAPRVVWALAIGAALLVSSAALSASVGGDMGGAVEIAGLVALFAAGVAASSATPVLSRPLLLDALLLIGAVVAATAWVGLVFRVEPWGYPIGDLWRGGSVLTYHNAAAAFLGMLFVLQVVRLAHDERPARLARLATYLLAVGIVTTVSRAGWVAVGVGLVVAVVASRPVRLRSPLLRLLVAAGIAAFGILPGLAGVRQTQPLISAAGLLLGAAVAAGVGEGWSRRTKRLVFGICGAVLVAAFVVVSTALGDVWERTDQSRLDVGSEARLDAWDAAFDEFVDSPVVGQGPSTTTLWWEDDEGAWSIQYVHNEYLELLAGQGLLGVLAAAVAVVLLVRSARGADLAAVPWLRAGVLGAVVVFFVHCGFDFLLHIPGMALAAGFIVGLGLPNMTTMQQEQLPAV